MIAIKNIENKELTVSFEGNDYLFPKGGTYLVGEKLVDHLKEIYPLAFDFEIVPEKDQVIAKVQTSKTKSYFGNVELNQDMRATQAGRATGTFDPQDETDNPGFYGKGIEDDDLK